LKLGYDETLSKFDFKINLRRYIKALPIAENKVLYGKYELYEKFPSTGLQILNMAAEQYDEVGPGIGGHCSPRC
jgi:hypothetical protein